MYDFGPTQAANDRLWAGLRDALRALGQAAPEALTRGGAAYWPAWESPHLVLSQTCGYPFRARLHGRVTLVATPDYGLPGCAPGQYCSVLVARAEDPRDRIEDLATGRMAWNEDLSQSGWAAPVQHLLALGLTPRPALRSGGHRRSAAAVAEGRADWAALDAVTWAMMQDSGDPAVPRLKVVGRTQPPRPCPSSPDWGRTAPPFCRPCAAPSRPVAARPRNPAPARRGPDSRGRLSCRAHAAPTRTFRRARVIKSTAPRARTI